MTSSSVTVPGNSVGTPVTVALGTGDVLQLASQIGQLLSTVASATMLNTTSEVLGSLTTAPIVGPGTITELYINAGGGSATIPSGYTYVVDNSSTATTLSGSSQTLITGTIGGSFNLGGQSTVAVEGGNNALYATGTYLISTAPGNDTISAVGTGTIAVDTGQNIIFASGDANTVLSIGQDTILSGVGITTVNASGAGSAVFGNAASGDLLFGMISGANVTVATFDSDSALSVSGSGDQIFGGQALSYLVVSGDTDTVMAGSGAETVSTSTNTLMFGGSGALTFVGGAGTATVVGGTASTEQVTVGSGGMVFSAGANNNSTVTSGDGATTVFGGANSVVNFVGNLAGGVLVGFAGNETLNAAGSSTANTFSAGADGNNALIGGSGDDTFLAGSGSSTMTGGGGSDIFAFFAGSTGGQNYITDFNSNDVLYLIGYDPSQTASSVQNAAVVSGSGVTLTLSDSTKITFTNLTSASELDGQILYGQRPS